MKGSEPFPPISITRLGVIVCDTLRKTIILFEERQVGHISNMVDIVTSMQMAEKIISFT